MKGPVDRRLLISRALAVTSSQPSRSLKPT
jgi:hypothetical protein